MDLKGYQRDYLSRKAHGLQPVVQIGKAGLTEPVAAAVDKALEDHELIKVKFVNSKDEKVLEEEQGRTFRTVKNYLASL